jgi:hypothetical protein
MSPSKGETASYDVRVKGDIGPAVCARLRRQCGVEVSHSARLVVRCPPTYDLTALHELLEKRGLTVISIRSLSTQPERAASP